MFGKFDNFQGMNPFSENESIAIRDLALENDFVFSIVWHSSRSGNLSEKVFTSWKWEEEKESPDIGIMKKINLAYGSSLLLAAACAVWVQEKIGLSIIGLFFVTITASVIINFYVEKYEIFMYFII